MRKPKINFTEGVSNLMSEATKGSESRWDVAAVIVAAQPSGLSTAPKTVLEGVSSPSEEERLTPPAATRSEYAPDVVNAEISRVRDNPRNARKLYDPEVVNQRAISLRRDGQMTPAPACIDWENPGSFILIGGHYRKRGLIQNSEQFIQLKLLKCESYAELYRLSYAENEERQSGTPLDDAMSWRELLDMGDVKSQDEIAALVSKPRTTINKTLALLNLQPTVLDILKQSPGKFSLTAGYELSVMATLFSEQELVTIAQQVAAGELSTRELSVLKDRKKNAKPRNQKQFSRQHKITMAGTSSGLIKDWDYGKVVLEVIIVDPVEREKLVNELRARFAVSDDNSEVKNAAATTPLGSA